MLASGMMMEPRNPFPEQSMKSRTSRLLFLSAAAAVVAAGLLGLHCSRSDRAPVNVLVITIDTLRADRLGCYGYSRPTTPHIDALAESGVRFENAFCQAPLTLPSHCSIFTSRYTLSHGSLGHAYPLNPEVGTLAEFFRAAGRTTAAFVSNHVLDSRYGLSKGFDTYWEVYRMPLGERMALKEDSHDPTTAAAVSWFREHQGEPFFVWVHWFHPHKPYDPPAEYAERFAGSSAEGHVWTPQELMDVWQGTAEISAEEVARLRDLYDGEVAFSDAQVGLLLDEMKRLGVYDRTLIVLTADHGEVLFEHDRYFGHDIMLYDPAMHVPLIVRNPAWQPAVIPEMVQSIDIGPTVLAALGVEAGAPLEGKDLAPLLRGDASASTKIAVCLSYPPEKNSLPIFGLSTDGWKLFLHESENGFRRELYDLENDPGEEKDLADENPDRASALETYYVRWAEAVEAHGRTSKPDLDPETLENLKSLGYIQ